ncbi:uncharacterized protein [Primulina eburnea]|uniref:uncharacterized protein n=1 Tax=Primulina eburnea TaxID=1245227 RepID=UPI003C6CB3E0
MLVDRSNTFDEAHNVDVMHVDRSNTDELYDEARDDIIGGEANLVQSNDANLVADVAIDNDIFSFTDGSNLFVGQEYPNREAVKKELIRISLEACFEFETVKSSQKVYAVKCVLSDCKWRIWTSLIKNDSRAFSVRTYCNTHTCGLTGRRKRIRGASSTVVRDILVDNFQGHPVPIVPKAVMAIMRNSMNADISYYKAWKGKELVYNMLKENPGSITDMFVDEENRFKYMFLAFGACGNYNGVLLVASAKDGNYHQYPLAWLEVVSDEDELVIISDRHQGIINAVSTVYRNAHHGHCSLKKLASSWFARYRHASIASKTHLTPTIEGILRSRFSDAQGMQVFKLGHLEFDVRSRGHSAIVDLESKRCTCRVFDIDRIPCAHAITASWLAKIDLYDMCSEYYSTMSWCMGYSETVYPVPEENEWSRNINFPLVLPPLLEKKVGRRKQNRIPSIGEFSKR